MFVCFPENLLSNMYLCPSCLAHIFDVDLMFHMNYASYLTHAELARWEYSAFNGTLASSFRDRSFFIVTASMIRFRREVPPLKRFDIETRLLGIDDKNLWVYQTFHNNNGNERGKVLAQVLTQAAIAKGGKVINPRSWVEQNFPAAKDELDDLSIGYSKDGVDSIFDEKVMQFTHLEQVLRQSAASYDEKVVK